jgi:hypothetical protein
MEAMSANIVLNLWKKNLGTVPVAVWERTNLTTLILADNKLTAISEQLGNSAICAYLIWVTTSLQSCPKLLAA